MTRWIALLRGINVGGHNRLPMADLRATASSLGHRNVTTWIQSGNLVFDSDESSPQVLAAELASAIEDRHGLRVPVVLRTREELAAIVGRHPGLGEDVPSKLLQVVFLSDSPPPDRVASLDPDSHAPDRWELHGREIFISYPEGSARSKLTIDVFERAFGVTATARNVNTVDRLVEIGGRD